MTSLETFKHESDPQPSSPLAVIRGDIYSVISHEPVEETENTLVYVNEMDETYFMHKGPWSASLRRAIEAGEITCETQDLDFDEMTERQMNEATNPRNPKKFYKHTIRLATK